MRLPGLCLDLIDHGGDDVFFDSEAEELDMIRALAKSLGLAEASAKRRASA